MIAKEIVLYIPSVKIKYKVKLQNSEIIEYGSK